MNVFSGLALNAFISGYYFNFISFVNKFFNEVKKKLKNGEKFVV